MKRATKADALKVLAAVKKQFNVYVKADPSNPPVLVKDWNWRGEPGWTIIWEGGPYDWAVMFNPEGGVVDEEMTTLMMELPEYMEWVRTGKAKNPVRTKPAPIPSTVWTEPYSGWALCIYRRNND